MKNFLRVTMLAICAIFMVAQANAQDNYDANTMGSIVRYYETAKWSQGSPFNNQCWTDATQTTHAKTGCVPTAFAIIMRHHGFPAQGIGTLYNGQTGAEFTDRTYDYSKMPLTNGSGWTTEQQNEVAKLMAHLGHAFGVSWGTGETSVSIGNTMSERMRDFFNYNYTPVSNQYAGSGQMYDFETWKNNLKNSLLNGCPVPYASNNQISGGRHMFIVDGFTENDYFHFNFGWGGGTDGWFKLDNITPTGDNYSWLNSSDGYDSKHQAYFNLSPNATKYDVTATVNDSNMGTVSINGGTAGSTVTANLMQGVTATLTAHPAQDYALANWTKGGVIVGSRNTIQVTVGTDANDYVANFDDAANVYVTKDYIITPSTVGLAGSSKVGVVNYQTSDEYPEELSLASTTTNGASLSAMSRISDDQIRLYAYDQATSNTTIKYTLSVPDDCIITEYHFDYSLNSTNHPCSISYNGGTITSPGDTEWHSSPTIANNAKTAEFTMTAEQAHSSSNFYIKNFTVTIAKEGANAGGSTPTTYTIYATAGTGGSVTINDEAVSQKNVNENSTVTVVATPQAGYNFVNWTSGTSTIVSTNATYSFTATGNTSLLANFAQATYTVNVEATEGGSAYIGTKGTTQATAAYNGNVTITAEANDGYEFVKWTDGEGNLFSTNASVPVSVTTDARYIAVFEAEANEPVEVSGDLEFTFTRNGSDVDVTVSGADGVTATITATSPDNTNTTTTTDIWNTGGAMANRTDVLCTSTNTSRATEGSPITYTLTVNGLRATVTDVAFTHVAVNSGGNLQPSDGTIRHCNFKLEANDEAVGTLSDQNIWLPSGSTDKTIEFNDLSVAADGTLTIKLTIYKGTSNDGCYYGLKKITLTAEETVEPTDPLAGKFFRLKVKNTTNYMNIANTSENTGSTSGVTVVAKNESSDTQIFLFEQSGDGYKLKANSGNYIKCHAWNANANTTSANDATVLTFETTGDELEYLIKWDNTNMNQGVERDDYFKAENGYVYCDAAIGSATTWVLEEVTPSNEKTLNVTFNNATYTKTDGTELTSGWGYQVVTQTTPAVTIKVAETINNFGYTTGVISGVKTPYLYKNTNFILSIPEPYKIIGYRMTVRGQDSNFSGDVTYTTNNQPGTVTLNGTTEKTISATGLETNTINIGVGGTAGNGIFITALEITYVEEEFTPLPFKAEVENWRNDNPNTHLGTITIGGTPMQLTPEHLNASELTMPFGEGTTLAFTRKYRGFEFQGFYIGETSLGENPTLTADNVAAIDENNPLIAKFTATDDVTLFYDDDEFSYRIPAIVKTGTNRLVAISDYRHSHDDIGRDNHGTGTLQVDLVMRISEDNGLTWSAKQTIAEGNQNFGYGDAAVVANGQNILVMAVAGNVFFTNATSSNKQRTYRIYSADNGVTWEKEEVSSNLYTLFPNANGMFFGSGKLVVDPNFNNSGNARVYGAVLLNDGKNYVVYSDNWGETWNILGGTSPASANEPKVEILPNGQILLSSRRNGGRTFNVFTYTNKANSTGTWSTATNGCDNGGNGTNGEIICLDAKKLNGKPTKILLQSQPYGSDRRNVSIWYKEISADETYTGTSIASGWTKGLQVSTQLSAYSAMCLQANGEIALFFEEAPCHNDDATYGYSMVYVPLTIEEITGENFLNPNADVETVTVDVTLTDNEGNTYTHQFDYLPGDAAAIDAALMTAYPFITELGEGNLQGSDTYYTYTNTVTLPFKVSNANTTVWHNIYWPANTRENDYPVYLSASSKDDTYVPKVTDSYAYGNHPTYNTLDGNEKISWAIYNVNNGFEFIFKNKVTDKYIQVTSVADDGAQNVVYVENIEDATAFTIFNKPAGNDYYTPAQYALAAKVGETTGYLCSTSATGYNYATHYFNNGNNGYGHQGAWIEFVEAPDYQAIIDQLIADIDNFGDGEGKYTANDAISSIDKDALATMPINSLNTQKENVQTVKDSYREITLTVPEVNDVVPGSVMILDEAVSNKFVQKGEVTIEAVPAAGYRFVNWTRPAAQASAAARTAEARNAVEVVSSDNPYTFNLTDAVSLEANFEEILVNVTLTDAQSNTYNVELSGFTSGVTKETVAAKLKEAYPYITLGSTDQNGDVIDFGVLEANGTAYTYTNKVELPFKVSNAAYLWHNIYYPSNNSVGSKPGCPNYIAALNEDEVVDMAASGGYYYGDNPTYNTKAGNSKISWAIYNVNNSFEFIFKNALTNKYIKVESVVNATGNTQNVKFVENAEDATAFTLLKDTGSYNGDYALVAKVGNATGYLCATSSSTNYVTHFDRNDHQGAWVKFVEAPDYYSKIMDLGIMLGLKFGAGDGKYINTDAISEIDNRIANNSENITLNTIKQDSIELNDAINSWPAVRLTINPVDGGTTNINGEAGVVHKYVPNDYELPLVAVPAEGYHFVNWTDGAREIETTEYTKTISGGKGDVIELTANFAINIYNISVTAGEGGSAMIGTETSTTVEHGSEVTLTAVENDGYEFVNWTKGTDVVSTDATYTFTATVDGEYVANFEFVGTQPTHYNITVNANISGEGIAFIQTGTSTDVTSGRYEAGSTITLNAVSDKDENGYLFVGWYIGDELVSPEKMHTITLNSNVTYTAVFEEGWRVRYSCNYRMGYIQVFNADGTEQIGGTNYVLVKKGSTIQMLGVAEETYQFKDWTTYATKDFVSSDNPYILEVNSNMSFTANFEPKHYLLTVRANDENYGTVTAESGTFGPAESVKVGIGMTATITATAEDGHKFVNWTLGGNVVSTDATYTVPAINEVNNLVDVEYIANFLPIENAPAGVYYRIGYDGFAAAANAGAARAAGDVQTLTISFANGSFKTGEETGPTSIWTSSSNSPTLTLTATYEGSEYKNIYKVSTTTSPLELSLNSRPYGKGSNYNETKYTIAIDDTNYKITAYSISYRPYSGGYIDGHNNNQLAESGLNVSNVSFTVRGTGQNSAVDIQSFTVTIQQVGGGEGSGETPANRYYIQSVASNVNGKTNALLMTKETDAASIFYYADSKLLSYDKGTYVKEDGGTRGLQAVGTSGTVTIRTTGKTSTIAAPSYMHANSVTSGTNTTYFIDHCGSNNGDPEHNFIIEEVTSLPVTISSALHATFYAPVAVEIPEGVSAYVLKEKNITADSWVTMTLLRNGIIPANTGVILKSEEAKTYYFDITENTDEARAEAVGNILEGTVAKSSVNKDAYILTKKSNGVGMYPLSNNSYITGGATATFTNNSHKAYLPVEGNFAQLLQQGTGFRFVFDDEGTTEIEDVEREVEDTIYDLQGRKLSEITEPGIYIVNGKKVWVK